MCYYPILLRMVAKSDKPPKGWLKPQKSLLDKPLFSTGDSDFATIHVVFKTLLLNVNDL